MDEFVIWALCETSHEWIEFCDMGSTRTVPEAIELGNKCGFKYWGIRKRSDGKPSFILPDKRWVE